MVKIRLITGNINKMEIMLMMKEYMEKIRRVPKINIVLMSLVIKKMEKI